MIQTKNNYQETRGRQPSEKILRDGERAKENKNEKTRKSEWVRQKEKRNKEERERHRKPEGKQASKKRYRDGANFLYACHITTTCGTSTMNPCTKCFPEHMPRRIHSEQCQVKETAHKPARTQIHTRHQSSVPKPSELSHRR